MFLSLQVSFFGLFPCACCSRKLQCLISDMDWCQLELALGRMSILFQVFTKFEITEHKSLGEEYAFFMKVFPSALGIRVLLTLL